MRHHNSTHALLAPLRPARAAVMLDSCGESAPPHPPCAPLDPTCSALSCVRLCPLSVPQVDPSSPNILNVPFIGDNVLAKLRRPFWTELQSRFGNLFFVREQVSWRCLMSPGSGADDSRSSSSLGETAFYRSVQLLS